MIRVSHEVPMSMLAKSKEFNDYDYCLVHLTDIHPEYKQFYLDSIKEGRQVLLDNSVFELDEPFDPDKFVEKINELNPTWYVVPDFLDDCDKTIQSMEDWIQKYLPKVKTDSKIIGSIQGATVADFVRCYKYMAANEHVAKIAMTFNAKCYEELVPGEEDILQTWTIGRQRFIRALVDSGAWCNEKPHHLLGAAYVIEFANPLYKDLNIDTIDTSNPIIYAMKKMKYIEGVGNDSKPKDKLCNHIEDVFDDEQNTLVDYNTKVFKSLLGR